MTAPRFAVVLALLVGCSGSHARPIDGALPSDAPSDSASSDGATTVDGCTFGQPVLQVHAGGGTVAGFVADFGGAGGSDVATTTAIDTTGVADAAPAALYQAQRVADANTRSLLYVFHNLAAGDTYGVRLHFAETTDTAAGQRQFGVAINNVHVETALDIYAVAGAGARAVVRAYTTTATAGGLVKIELDSITGFDPAMVSGIELVATSCGPAPAPPKTTHIACLGDSITAGIGASSPATDYPSDLQALVGSGVTVGNFGHSGATLLFNGDTPYNQQAEWAAAQAFVAGAGSDAVVDVIIMLGTNDSKPANWDGGTQVANFETSYSGLIDTLLAEPTHPTIFLGLPPTAGTNPYTIDGSVIATQIVPLVETIAATREQAAIDLHTPVIATGDGVHPTDAGYVTMTAGMFAGIGSP